MFDIPSNHTLIIRMPDSKESEFIVRKWELDLFARFELKKPSEKFLNHIRLFPYQIESDHGSSSITSSNGYLFVERPSFLEDKTIHLSRRDVKKEAVEDFIRVCSTHKSELQSCSLNIYLTLDRIGGEMHETVQLKSCFDLRLFVSKLSESEADKVSISVVFREALKGLNERFVLVP